jgi:phosphatidylinositol alpha-1,6-mannosyltransferase
MKTLLITIDYLPNTGGVARYLEGFRKKYEVDVLAPQFSESEEGIIRRRLLWPLPPKWLPLLFWGLFYARNYDEIIISHILPSGYVALLAKKPYTVILHGLDIVNASKGGWKRYWAKKILDRAKKIVVNSRATGELLRKSLGDLYNYEIEYPLISALGAQDKDLRAEFLNKKIILSLGRLVKRKGQEKILRLMPRILQEMPEAIFVIAGGGPERENYELQITNYKLQNHVFLLGKVKESELPNLYAACDIFVMPSIPSKDDWEGFGIVCLEAAYFGKPVVVTNAGGLPEAVLDNVTGFVVQNDEELLEKIIYLLKNSETAEKMGALGKKRVEDKFLITNY